MLIKIISKFEISFLSSQTKFYKYFEAFCRQLSCIFYTALTSQWDRIYVLLSTVSNI